MYINFSINTRNYSWHLCAASSRDLYADVYPRYWHEPREHGPMIRVRLISVTLTGPRPASRLRYQIICVSHKKNPHQPPSLHLLLRLSRVSNLLSVTGLLGTPSWNQCSLIQVPQWMKVWKCWGPSSRLQFALPSNHLAFYRAFETVAP